MDPVQFGPARVAVEPMQHDDAEVRRELRQLGRPVGDQAGGNDDQRRTVEPCLLVLDGDVGNGLRGLAQAHVVGQEAAQPMRAQVLQPGDAVLLVGAQRGLEPGRHVDGRDLRRATELGGVGLDGARIVPPRGQQVFEVEQAGSLGGLELEAAVGGAPSRIDQVRHHGQQTADALGRQLEDAAVVQAGDELAIGDEGRVHAAAVEQAREDGQQRHAGAVDLDAEIERERAGFAGAGARRGHVADAEVVLADRLHRARPELLVDPVAPAQRHQHRHALAHEPLPAFGGVAAAEQVDDTALGARGVRHPHLVEAVLA